MPKGRHETMGALLRSHREAAGLSRRAAAELVGVAPRQLRRWESGRATAPIDSRQALAAMYAVDEATLVPPRSESDVALAEGTLSVGSRTSSLDHPVGDHVLREYVAAVLELRRVEPDACSARAADLALLARLLGSTEEAVAGRVASLLDVDEEQACEIASWIFRGRVGSAIVVAAPG